MEKVDLSQKSIENTLQMAVVGGMALQAMEEIKNLVNATDSHAKLLLDHASDKEYIDKFIGLVENNKQRIDEIFNNLQAFGSPAS